jgi:hypothetical protein
MYKYYAKCENIIYENVKIKNYSIAVKPLTGMKAN